ncbi:hypothetical protein AGDE_04200 [Angomonas deanei]|uniref:Uncharacterized protein n=1 Tax=Angomonas deanei TaxID=59799 RepID=S9UIN6_9TRYP|nr:hypothetical protein AGDE_09324 [Angomonas deanei]EPY39728.1 hypothetical protein AGDE_04200 [Angomonas deanei]CAD2215455.1 Domain of unknown function (DUF543), putative [Angomonas deanei]|eukprot:EPY30672.1 hypothetical protein AGDE_09324 [Angomonas deanei]
MSSIHSSVIPTEEKWDHAVEAFVRKTTIGFAAGILPALLLVRVPVARGAVLALCTGIGSGIAYGEARYLFDHNISFDKRHLIDLDIVPKKVE